MAVGVVVVHAGLSAVSDCAMGEESEGNEWNAGAQNRGRQLRTEAGRKLVGSEGGGALVILALGMKFAC